MVGYLRMRVIKTWKGESGKDGKYREKGKIFK